MGMCVSKRMIVRVVFQLPYQVVRLLATGSSTTGLAFPTHTASKMKLRLPALSNVKTSIKLMLDYVMVISIVKIV